MMMIFLHISSFFWFISLTNTHCIIIPIFYKEKMFASFITAVDATKNNKYNQKTN